MGLVVVRPVDPARADDPDRRLAKPEHGPDLHRRGVGPKQHAARPDAVAERGLLQVEGVLHVAGGVVGRDVERLEVVGVELDLGPARHRVAEPAEDGGDLLGGAGDGVAVAARPLRAPRERDIDGASPELRLERPRLEPRPPLPEQPLDLVAHPVGDLTDLGAHLGDELPHASEHLRQLALLAQEADPEVLEGLVVDRGADGTAGARRQRLELLDEVGHGPRPGRSSPPRRSRRGAPPPDRPGPCGRAPRRPCAAPRPAASRWCHSAGRPR